MKKTLLTLCLVFIFTGIKAQETINLPAPNKTGGKALMDCLNERHSTREYKDAPLSLQQLSDLLWATAGINRPEAGKKTAPNSRNKQEIDLYLAKADGVFKYDPVKHCIQMISDEDLREKTGKQDFVGKASLSLIYVADYERIGMRSEIYKTVSCLNTGLMVQNAYLYCASEGLGSVCRGYFDAEEVHQMLKLTEGQEVILTQTVGIPE
jgi:hypothetical protein